jgi:hypothetical protein
MPACTSSEMEQPNPMPNKGMPKTDDRGWGDIGLGGVEHTLAKRDATAHQRRITSDDERQGYTCLKCLDGVHSQCYVWEGQRTCPCSICGKTHNRTDLAARRYERQRKRTTSTPRPRPQTEPRPLAGPHNGKSGPQPFSEAEKEQVWEMIGKLVLAVVTDDTPRVTVS